jgi:hypothetical protein
MSKRKPPKNKQGNRAGAKASPENKAPRKATPRTRTPNDAAETLTFGRQTYIWMAAGVGLMAIGLLLMLGGEQPPNEWDPSEIYSFRRTVLSPLVILAGLGVVWYAIAKK